MESPAPRSMQTGCPLVLADIYNARTPQTLPTVELNSIYEHNTKLRGGWSGYRPRKLCRGSNRYRHRHRLFQQFQSLPYTFTRMFEPRHNILSNARADIGKYVVSWLKHSRETDTPAPGPIIIARKPAERQG